MARIYQQTIIKWAKSIGLPAGTIGSVIVLYILYSIFVGDITVTGNTNDMKCWGADMNNDGSMFYSNWTPQKYNGEYEACFFIVNFTANRDSFWYPINYDPWGRNESFMFNPSVKSWKIYRSWGKGWREIPMTVSCTGTWCGSPDNTGTQKYSVVWRDTKSYTIMVVAEKNKPSDTIKWAFYNVDPFWLGISARVIFMSPTPADGTNTTVPSILINVSISDKISKIVYKWNETNYTVYDNSIVLLLNFENISSLGENNTQVKDASIFGNTLLCPTADCPTVGNTGVFGNAARFYFQGTAGSPCTNDCRYADTLRTAYNISDMTYAAWLYFNTTTPIDDYLLISIGNANAGGDLTMWSIFLTNDNAGAVGKLVYQCNKGTTWAQSSHNSTVDYNATYANKWTYVTVTKNDTSVNMYFNGVLDSSQATGTKCLGYIGPSVYGLTIGADPNKATEGWHGYMDEVMLWNRTLSSAEINQLYMSNLYRFDTYEWLFYVNQSNSPNVLTDGTYTYQMFVADNESLWNSTENRKIRIDNVKPRVTVIAPLAQNYSDASMDFNVSLDEEGNMCIFTLDSWLSNYTMLRLNATHFGYRNSSIGIGTYTAKFWCNDTTGNINNTLQVVFLIVNVAPKISFVSPTFANNAFTINKSIVINVSITDMALSKIVYNWNGTNFTIYDNSLILLLNFENLSAIGENTTLARDISIFGDNATCNISTCPSLGFDGKYGKSARFYFEGTLGSPCYKDCKYTIPYKDRYNISDMTLSGWLYFNTSVLKEFVDDYVVIMAGSTDISPINMWTFKIANEETHDGMFKYQCNQGAVYAPNIHFSVTNYSAAYGNKWTHVVLTKNDTFVAMYFDGVLDTLVATGTFCKGFVNLNAGLTIGTETGKSTEGWHGYMDDFMIWNRTLTSVEVNQQYMTSLVKYNVNSWTLFINQTKSSLVILDNGSYNYQAFAAEELWLWNSTDKRNVHIDTSSCLCASIQAGITVNCAENCTITACNANGQNIVISGFGRIIVTGDVSNYGKLTMKSTSGSSPCVVSCTTGCFKR